MPTPAKRDVPYGPHPLNVLDFYPPTGGGAGPWPLYVFIHGGGFRSGDKANLPVVLAEGLLARGVAVAAVNYRLSDLAPYPAAMTDCARAVQFLRTQAAAWGVDGTRLAAGGGSAGAGISQWLGFGPDRADPTSPDPVARQSTRLSAIGCWQAQCSYDPHFIRAIIPGIPGPHAALRDFFRVPLEDIRSDRALRMFHDASPINFITPAAPPVYVWYKTRNVPVTDPLEPGVAIHHPQFGITLRAALTAVGVECVVRFREECPESDAVAETYFLPAQAAWLAAKLGR